MQKKDLVAIRPASPDDYNFILATWLRGIYYGDSWFSLIPKDIFMPHYHKVIDGILRAPETIILVACLIEDSDVILGYNVCKSGESGSISHFIYVKSAWRKIGIARSLVPDNLVAATHLTKLGKALMPKGCVFNPFLI